MNRALRAWVLGLISLVSLASASPEPRMAQEPASGGGVKGRVAFEGKVPKDRKISLEGDKYCSAARPDGMMSEFYKVAADGSVRNVFVYVKKGLEGRTFDVPKQAVVLDQSGCRYDPHVFGIRVGQELLVRNNDETLHNIHSGAAINPEFNFSQATKGNESKVKFVQPEVMVRIKCDVHGWMSTYAGVVTHPHFQVTGDDGRFELKGLPAGTYVLEAWHEKFGSLEQTVKVADGAAAEVAFTFKGK